MLTRMGIGMSSKPSDGQKTERRGRMSPVPENICALLNQKQKDALREVENQGWTLAFVRRPILEDPTVVVSDADGSRFAVVDRSGTVDMDAPIRLRL